MRILAILGIVFVGVLLLFIGVKVLAIHDDAMLRPPDDTHHTHWPDGDDTL